ncbi:type VI secretion system membrane subunit TssM [Simiduia agarivorans]|uniref:Type VI secretion protein IcmF n=1 Tax=Simiduia agarivorans (strain DSM 21679 / JCM 13881 / BCRC 17597 / SA1) TaxID=1117647 RepID=K4KGH7_SIMAS|nr:type VI secretion system membrane subunit TssM [Simiduia agarivorans]AFU98091.1 hypothetical protein M5M_04420 [Simiduia agarivorans SA1 = DSM 21679]
MKRLADFFTHKWTLGILGLLALSCVVWFGADYIKFGEDNHTLSSTTRIAIIGVCWLIWIVWQIATLVLERRQNDALIASIQEEPESVSPDEERSREELETIAQRFREAMVTLKKARFKKGGRALSLYQLPWYIIIGPPGAGKTTALINSGLEFPLAKQSDQKPLAGVGGTRNCDWWFTNDAVLIDTAGRYTTQDSHRAIDNTAWRAFIDLLKRHRRRRPINGAILAISLQDLMVQTAEQRTHQAKTLRTRINELHQEFGIRFPIYLTFTKCDLVAGFAEFFSNLSQAEREQVWGVSFPYSTDADVDQAIAGFSGEFDLLIERLNQRVLWRVQQERNLDRRAVLQAFPARMEALSEVISEFVKQTFAGNRYDTQPLLRGVYFTSATQEGSPIDRMMASVSANFGLDRDMGKVQNNSGKSFFLHRLLKHIIFPESELVGVNKKIETSLLWGRRAAMAALTLATAGTLLLWSGSLAQNKIKMAEVSQATDAFQTLEPALRQATPDLETVAKAFEHLAHASSVYDQDDHPWLQNLGLYDPSVDHAADRLYSAKLREYFYPLLAKTLAAKVREDQYKDAELIDSLKLYLMLFDSERRDLAAIGEKTNKLWTEQLTGKATVLKALNTHLLKALQEPVPQDFVSDTRLVQQSRRQLARMPVAQRIFGRLESGNLGQTEVSITEALGLGSPEDLGLDSNSESARIPLLYTKASYKELDFTAESPLLDQLDQDRWIYGGNLASQDLTETDREQIIGQVKKRYMTRYADEWNKLLAAVQLTRLNSTHQAIDLLDQWADPISSPLLALIQITAENTELTPSLDLDINTGAAARIAGGRAATVASLGGQALGSLASRLPPTPVDLQFDEIHRLVKTADNRPAKIQDYLAALDELKEFLMEIDSAPDSNEAAFVAAKARFGNGGGGQIKQLRVKAQGAPEPLNLWINAIADQTWGLLLAKTKLHIDQIWHEQVFSSYRSNLQGRYPMASHVEFETPVGEFNRYFKPGGIEQQFVNSYLSHFIDVRRWTVKSLEGQSLKISNKSLRQFRQADDIRRAYFSGGPNASMQFKIEPTKLDSGVRLFALELGENRVNYSHGPRTLKPMKWTGGEDMRVRVIFEDLNETVHRKHYEGDWSWLRLLDDSHIDETGNKSIKHIVFEENGRRAEFRLVANTGVNPFDRQLLKNYDCPQYL